MSETIKNLALVIINKREKLGFSVVEISEELKVTETFARVSRESKM